MSAKRVERFMTLQEVNLEDYYTRLLEGDHVICICLIQEVPLPLNDDDRSVCS